MDVWISVISHVCPSDQSFVSCDGDFSNEHKMQTVELHFHAFLAGTDQWTLPIHIKVVGVLLKLPVY